MGSLSEDRTGGNVLMHSDIAQLSVLTTPILFYFITFSVLYCSLYCHSTGFKFETITMCNDMRWLFYNRANISTLSE